MRNFLTRRKNFLDGEPGPFSSFLAFIAAALALGALLSTWRPPF